LGVLVPSHGVLAYVGLGPGQEFLPQFLALLGLVGAALLSIFHWPLSFLFRLFSKGKSSPGVVPPDVPEPPAKANREGP
jgi:hypothetical protein